MKNHIKTHRILTKITKEFCQKQSEQTLIRLYKYNKRFDKGHIMIIENKIKLVTGVKIVEFSPCYK